MITGRGSRCKRIPPPKAALSIKKVLSRPSCSRMMASLEHVHLPRPLEEECRPNPTFLLEQHQVSSGLKIVSPHPSPRDMTAAETTKVTTNCSKNVTQGSKQKSLPTRKRRNPQKKKQRRIRQRTENDESLEQIMETKEFKDRTLLEGHPVYAEYMNEGEDQYFWGKIAKKYKKNEDTDNGHLFDIQFHDGDYRIGVPSTTMMRLEEYLFHKMTDGFEEDDDPPNEYLEHLEGRKPGVSLQELKQWRCENCFNCNRSPCGMCHSCAGGTGLCLRRVCCKIPPTQKIHAAPFFPLGWGFYFNSDINSSDSGNYEKNLDGLVILSPKQRHFYSVENAMNSNKGLFAALEVSPMPRFYTFVGLQVDRFEKDPLDFESSSIATESISLEDIDLSSTSR